jgi:hypothetical protein
MRRRRWIGLTIGLVLAMSAAPADAYFRNFGHWRVTVSGSLRQQWAFMNSGGCEIAGPGTGGAQFSGSARISLSYNSFRVRTRTTSYWGGGSEPHLRGTASATDATTINPPEPGQRPCDPPPPKACGSRPLRADAMADVGGSTRRPRDMEVLIEGLGQRLSELDACTVQFTDFGNFAGARGAEIFVRMPSLNAVGRRIAFAVSATETFPYRRSDFTSTVTRTVRLRFTPVR